MNPAVAVIKPILSTTEALQLKHLEDQLAAAEGAAVIIGRCLEEIFTKRLFRPATWEAYCLARWDLSSSSVWNYRNIAAEHDRLAALGFKVLPSAFATVGVLLEVEDVNTRTNIWRAAVEKCGGKPIRKRHVEAAAEKVLGRPVRAAPGECAPETLAALAALSPKDQAEVLERVHQQTEAAKPTHALSAGQRLNAACEKIRSAAKALERLPKFNRFAKRLAALLRELVDAAEHDK
jgi:hypothetical protein